MDNSHLNLNDLSNNSSYDFIEQLMSTNNPNDNLNLPSDIDSPYDSSIFSCEYIDPTAFVDKFHNCNDISIMSFNIQSLPAKFNDFSDLISFFSNRKCSPDIICLQEIWQIHNITSFSLPGYSTLQCKMRTNDVRGGGWGLHQG